MVNRLINKRYKMINTNLADENGRIYYNIQREDGFNICQVYGKNTAKSLIDELNELSDENGQLKSTIAQLIEQNRKNNDLLLSDIRILEKALWCGGCENDYGRLKELRKEFMR